VLPFRPGSDDLQPRTNARIRIFDVLERAAVQLAADRGSILRQSRIIVLGEKIESRPLSCQSRAIQQRTGERVRTGLRQHIKVLFGAIVFTSKTKQLK
jgi:hypothetical protein